MISSDELKAMRERLEAATPGPWTDYPTDSYGGVYEIYAGPIRICTDIDGVNIELLANARTDMERLIAEVERLKRVEKKILGISTRAQVREVQRFIYDSWDQARDATEAEFLAAQVMIDAELNEIVLDLWEQEVADLGDLECTQCIVYGMHVRQLIAEVKRLKGQKCPQSKS